MSIRLLRLVMAASFACLVMGEPSTADANSLFSPSPTTDADGPPPLPENDGPPPLPPTPDLSYYIGVGGTKVGPLDTAGLQKRIVAGELTKTTLVWTKGMGDWAKAATRSDLMALMTPDTPPEPAGGFDAKKFVIGTWRSSGTTLVPQLGSATIDGEETFGANGKYTGKASLVVANPPAELSQMGLTGALKLDVTFSGTYKVLKQSGRNYTLEVTATVTVKDLNGLGLNNSEKSTETVNYVAVDDDTFKDLDDSVIGRRI